MRASTHNHHTSWRHIWRLAWPIIMPNITVPLVGATRGQDMRNAMIFSAGGLGIALLLLAPWGLQGLLFAFVGYLGLRGASLWWHIDRVYGQAGPPLHQQ